VAKKGAKADLSEVYQGFLGGPRFLSLARFCPKTVVSMEMTVRAFGSRLNNQSAKGASNSMISPDDFRKRRKWPSTVQRAA